MEREQALNQSFGTACTPSDSDPECPCEFEADRNDRLADILFEQLSYLLEYAEQERDRLELVTQILMAPFAEAHSK